MRRFSLGFLLCIACGLLVAMPLWTHRWLPIQDLPQHLATLRIVHEVHIGGPATAIYDVDLAHTQYILFTVVGDVLALVFSVRTSGLILLTAYMVGTVAGMYALLRSLGRDGRLALLVVPLLTNTQFLIGLLQFLIGIPLMLWGWSIAIDYLHRSRRRDAILLGIVAVAMFYSHVVIFGIFVIGLALFAPWKSLHKLVRFALPLVPAGLVLAHWVFFTGAGEFVVNAVTSGKENKDLWPFDLSFSQMYSIAFDTYRDSADERLFAEAAMVGIVMTVLAGGRSSNGSIITTRRWLLLPLVVAILYFRSEGTNGFLGHIRDRFSLVAFITLIPALRMPRGVLGHLGAIAGVVISAMTAETLDWHCSRFEEREVGDFDTALAQIPASSRVAGLIYSSTSERFNQNPFLHYPAYYVVEKGGVANFSFAGYPHWVYRYKPHQDPSGASPPAFLWEWQPERASPREELAASYDYVLTRGLGPDLPDDLFVKAWEGTQWTVWQRRTR